jgi:hypothetical protein
LLLEPHPAQRDKAKGKIGRALSKKYHEKNFSSTRKIEMKHKDNSTLFPPPDDVANTLVYKRSPLYQLLFLDHQLEPECHQACFAGQIEPVPDNRRISPSKQ